MKQIKSDPVPVQIDKEAVGKMGDQTIHKSSDPNSNALYLVGESYQKGDTLYTTEKFSNLFKEFGLPFSPTFQLP